MSLKKRKIITLVVGVAIIAVVGLVYKKAENFLFIIHSHAYQYAYFPSKDILEAPLAEGTPATAVPILMYHGVRVVGELGTNTERESFIEQMEMLKREGYQTISVAEYDAFREGDFVLPAKPIIITFDDGRKDSFYTVDNIIKKLGFKATNFIASIKPNDNDPFFLTWDELKRVQATGRWELEAHGRHSHDKVVIDADGNEGRYLSALIYDPETGLESIENFETRVEQDYLDGLQDLRTNLGIEAKYFAVPLNDYGNQDSNYDGGITFNRYLSDKYFKFSFIESSVENNDVLETFYNYKNSNPHTLKRLEVMNMSADQLKFALDKFAPDKARAVFPFGNENDQKLSKIRSIYGVLTKTDSELKITSVEPSTAARAILGDKGWQNYVFEAQIARGQVREAAAIIYYLDEDNMIIMDWEDHNVSIKERVEGTETHIAAIDDPIDTDINAHISMSVNKGLLNVHFNGVQLVDQYEVQIPRGAPAFGVWDPNGGEVRLTSFSVTSFD
ncbi:polysaccharide deacetylase family protein [Candidatus Nomurabacteria bacterium]|nr:polysaccharide deacetylase family protein [Candidatus Nomurabacteria bacterium]